MGQITNTLNYFFSTDLIKVIVSIFPIYVMGYALQVELFDPIKKSWHDTFIRSFFTGFGLLGICSIPTILFQNLILEFINNFEIMETVGSLIEAYIFITIVFFYFPVSFIFCCCLHYKNKKKIIYETEKLRRPLFR